MSIALKETSETKYWIRLLQATDYLSDVAYNSVLSDCMETEKILVRIIKTSREKLKKAIEKAEN